MITAREKANLNQMLMSGDIKNIGLAFDMILKSKEDLYWIARRAKERLNSRAAFFRDKGIELSKVLHELHRSFLYENDRTIGMDMAECEKIAKSYKDKLDDIVAKSNAFNIVFTEKEINL